MKGDKNRLWRFMMSKTLTIMATNVIDMRMQSFFENQRTYRPAISQYPWTVENYITDKKILKLVPLKQWYALTPEERVELKAALMVRQWLWKTFHIWNKANFKNPKHRVKLSPDTSFEVDFVDKGTLKRPECYPPILVDLVQ